MSKYAKIKKWLKTESLYEYAWEAVGGDDRTKRKLDSKLINRSEGYEVCDMIEDVLDKLEMPASGENILTVEHCIQDSTTRSREELLDEIVEELSE